MPMVSADHPLKPSSPSSTRKKDEDRRQGEIRITSEETDVSPHRLHLSSVKPEEQAANAQFPL